MNASLLAQTMIRSSSRSVLRSSTSVRLFGSRSIYSNSSNNNFASHSRTSQVSNASKRFPSPSQCLSQSRNFTLTTPKRQESEKEEEQREKTSGEQDIEDILNKQFTPKHLEVQDVSGGCGSFYAIVIASSQFKGISTIKAHRLVNAALKDIIKDIHGLQLRTMAVDDE